MSEALLTLLRWCLLALIYLFFFRVLQATLFSTVAGRKPAARAAGSNRGRATVGAGVAAGGDAGSTGGAGKRAGRKRSGREPRGAPTPVLVVVEPATAAGQTFEVTSPLSIGRAAGCEVTLDDTFISQVHARVTRTANGVVVEDLGSTNGTYLNRKRVTAPVVVQAGDVIQVGSTVLELQ